MVYISVFACVREQANNLTSVCMTNHPHAIIISLRKYFYFQSLEIQPELSVHMAAANSSPPGSLDLNQPGFAKEILGTKLEVKYLCSDCKNILRRPFQAQCGHRYCSYCLKKIIR